MKKLFTLFGMLILTAANSQVCNNFDFESGNLSGWTVTRGQPSGFNNLTMSGCCTQTGSPEAIIKTTPFFDTQLGTIPHSPFGGTKVVMLNDSNITVNTGLITRISYSLVVGPNMVFQYAISSHINGMGHPCTDHAYNNITVKNSVGTPVYSLHIIPPSPTGSCSPVAFTNTVNNTAFFCWKTFSLNLSPYIGTTVTIDVTAGDCTAFGHYGYCYFDATCTTATPTNAICGSLPTALEERSIENSVRVWPNPATDVLHFSLNGSSANTLLVFDLLGKVVLKQTDLKEKNTITIKDLQPGVYFYKVINSSKEISGKFIKE